MDDTLSGIINSRARYFARKEFLQNGTSDSLKKFRRGEKIASLGSRQRSKIDPNVEEQPDPVQELFYSFMDSNEEAKKQMSKETSSETEDRTVSEVIQEESLDKAKENYSAKGYGDITQEKIEEIITREAKLRDMDINTAIRVYRAEGLDAYQSKLKYKGGREKSYGPYQLFTEGGLGNVYQDETGRELSTDNTLEGITKQIQWSLDYAAKTGSWSPWKGAARVKIKDNEGLSGSKPVYNWKET